MTSNYGSTTADTRVILLFDMGSFEVQVHQKSIPESMGQPCVVVNPSGRIVAVSYEAKKLGINRDSTPRLHLAQNILPDIIAIKIPEKRPGCPDTSIARAATFEIFTSMKNAIRNLCPSAVLESASADEFYVDVTAVVDEYIANARLVTEVWPNTCMYSQGRKNEIQEIQNLLSDDTFLNKAETQELRLLQGAGIAKHVVDEILKQTGYQSSLGIAMNKIVAKLASGLHKPGSVTICAPSGWETFSKDVKIMDIPNLGGKRGGLLKAAGYSTMRELQTLDSEGIGKELQLLQRNGEDITQSAADAYWRCAQGICDEPVVAKEHHGGNAIVSQHFNSQISLHKMKDNLGHLCEDMVDRLDEEKLRYNRVPAQISVNIEISNSGNMNESLPAKINSWEDSHFQFVGFVYKLANNFWQKNGWRWNQNGTVVEAVLTAEYEAEGKQEADQCEDSPNGEKVMQFKIILLHTQPPVWRRIQVPSTFTFWGLHCAIQDAMGWKDHHLHSFEITNPETKKSVLIEENETGSRSHRNEYNGEKSYGSSYVGLTRYYPEGTKCNTVYSYDFGDDWEHSVTLEGILPAKNGVKYPICSNGERACPPEDCGGTFGFEKLLQNLRKNHNSRTRGEKGLIVWLRRKAGGSGYPNYDPAFFDPRMVKFSDQGARLAMRRGD